MDIYYNGVKYFPSTQQHAQRSNAKMKQTGCVVICCSIREWQGTWLEVVRQRHTGHVVLIIRFIATKGQ